MTSTPDPAARCTETLRELQTYLDDEVAADVKLLVDEHLVECTDCMQAFDFHAELKIVISRKCRSEAPLPDSLLQKIELCFGIDTDEILEGSGPDGSGVR